MGKKGVRWIAGGTSALLIVAVLGIPYLFGASAPWQASGVLMTLLGVLAVFVGRSEEFQDPLLKIGIDDTSLHLTVAGALVTLSTVLRDGVRSLLGPIEVVAGPMGQVGIALLMLVALCAVALLVLAGVGSAISTSFRSDLTVRLRAAGLSMLRCAGVLLGVAAILLLISS